MEKRLTMILAGLFLCVGMALAQTAVKGTVVSQEDGQPIVGATVHVPGTQVGAVTDANGQFKLTVPAGKKTVRISYVGMLTQEVAVKPTIRVALQNDDKMLDEVMVVAFGTAKKSAFTGSAKVVGSETLAQSQVSDVTAALAGSVPGVTLTSANGGPGSSPTIRIRGFSSLNAGKDPLIIVDGAPYSGDMNSLNPNDVESMTVLKDAASSALYGARGANGVVIITTKTAKKGQDAKVTFDAKWGGNTRALQHYDVIESPAQYYEMQFAALNNYYLDGGASASDAYMKANSVLYNAQADNGGLGYNIWTIPAGQYLIGTDGRLNPNATLGRMVDGYWITPDNWEDEGTRTGLRQEYNVSINAASNRSTFYMSLGYLENEGISYNSDYRRFTGRLRGDYQVKSWLKTGANMSYARFNGNSLGDNGSSTSTGNVWAFTSQIAPIYPLYLRDADKNVMVDDHGITMMDYGNGMNAGLSRPFLNDANALQDVLLNTRNYEGNAVYSNAFADITFMPGLVLTLNGTFNLNETRSTYVYNRYYGQFDTTGGTVEKGHSRTWSRNFQQILNYSTSIAKQHNLNVMLGHEYYDYRYYILGASKSQMFSDNNKELSGAVIDGKGAYSYKTRYNNEGYFGRVQYDYDQRIFGSASYRRDASSRFHPDNRWGDFWSLGGAWIISKEKWFDASWVDMLKFKASIGSQGNDNIGAYRYVDTYGISNANNLVGTAFEAKGNKDITWETQTNFNAGVEFDLFNRLSGSIEYYYRKTSDMLMAYSVAPSIGYTSYYANVGDLYNTGVELDMKVNILKSKNVNWDFDFNISSIKNRVSKLADEHKNGYYYTANGEKVKGFTSGSFFIAEGQSIYTWRLKDYAGVDPETGEPMWWKNTYAMNEDGTFKLDADGDKVWAGREKTKVYNDADYYMTEKTTVPKWQGGFGTMVRAYGFDLSFHCSFQLGGKAYDSTYASFMSSPTSNHGGWNFHKDLLNSWSPDNVNSSIPRFQYGDQYGSSSSTRFLTSSDYLNIENINFGYTVPASLLSKIDVTSLRFYLACENVCYFSARKGFDPRLSYSDIDTSNATTYSPMRTISAGLTVQF